MSNTSLTTKVTQSRGWTLALGIAAAALAAILLIAYLVQYRSSVNASTAPTPVLVAKNLIPKGTSGHRHRREGPLPGRDAAEGRPQGRRDLRPGVPERARRGRRHLPRPADHDRRRQRRPHRRDPDAAHGQAARGRDPGRRGPRASSATSQRRPRRRLLRRPAQDGTVLGLLAPNVLSCARRRGGSRRSSVPSAGLAQKLALASDTGTLWFLLRPAGDASAAEEVDHEHELLQQINAAEQR